MRPFLFALVLASFVSGLMLAGHRQDPPDTPKVDAAKSDLFFAGTVVESTPAKLKVSRVVLGKTEMREFGINADTKVEGKLKAKLRVTVRYVTTDDKGDVATLVVIRPTQTKKK